jgi:hypothetical protein
MADILEKERQKDRPLNKTGPYFINFVKEGAKSSKSTSNGILHDSKNWEMLVDLEKNLKFLEEVTLTSLRPDMWSKSLKLMVMVNLAVPWEERVKESREIKILKEELGKPQHMLLARLQRERPVDSG